jgi:CRISPR/Cas system-associated endoribonuclease Cas2
MEKSFITGALVAALALPGLALAQPTTRVDKRQEKQDQRIQKGVDSGQLNQKEAARLEKGQAHVEKLEDKALEDGKMTKKEKIRIEHAQDVQSKRIARERHDKQKAK